MPFIFRLSSTYLFQTFLSPCILQAPLAVLPPISSLKVFLSNLFLQNNSIRYFLPPTADTPEKTEGLTGKD